jgi:glycosyltransferase involved in cell wall biosynthesis
MRRDSPILLLTHNYPRWPGDFAGVFLQALTRHLVDDGISVTVLAPHSANAEKFEVHGKLTVRRFRYLPVRYQTLAYTGNMHKQAATPAGLIKFLFYLTANVWTALMICWRSKPKLIFAQWLAPSGLVAWLVSLIARRPLYVTSHGTDVVLLKKSGILRAVARLIYRRAKKAFTVSSFLREEVMNLDLCEPVKLEVAPMPARVDLFGKQRAQTQQPPLVLAVARFTRQKRLHILIEAVKLVQADGHELVCEVYGEGELESELLELIEQLELTGIVHLRKPIDQQHLAQRYASARITVLPSVREGFGMTLVEAQLSGSAVIGARSGGITDIIRHEETGLLFEPDNIAQLAQEIAALLTDDALHHRLVNQARNQAERLFSPRAIARRYEQALGL